MSEFEKDLANVMGSFMEINLDCVEKQNQEIEQLQQENQQLKEQVKELKHIMYVIRDDNGLNHLWCKDIILDWLGSDSK